MTWSCWLRRRLIFGSEKTPRCFVVAAFFFFALVWNLCGVFKRQRYFNWSPQTLCECALSSPYISLKLGMLAVLSTLSGTIAIKQYFSHMTGCLHFQTEAVVPCAVNLHVFNCNSPPGGGPSVSPRLTDLVKLAQECCYHSNLPVAAYGVIVLVNITVSCPDKGQLRRVPDHIADGFHFLLGWENFLWSKTAKHISYKLCNAHLTFYASSTIILQHF